MKSRWECPFSEWIFTLTHIKYILTFRYFRYRQVLSRFLYIFMHIDHRPLSKRWPQNKIGSKLCTWIDEVKTNVWLFISSLAQCRNLINWWKKNGFFMYGNEPYWLYGALQIILATFYQFLTKEVFCQEVTFFCHVSTQKSIQIWMSTNKESSRYFEIWIEFCVLTDMTKKDDFLAKHFLKAKINLEFYTGLLLIRIWHVNIDCERFIQQLICWSCIIVFCLDHP